MCFPDINAPRRIHEEFDLGLDESYHTGLTLLTALPKFSVIYNIPSGYMHLVLLETMKKCIAL